MGFRLTIKQSEIVNHKEGALLVKAGPGSGKTRVLIERVKEILKSGSRIHVLALTFSNMAADEMRNRLQDDAEIADLLDNVTVGTIHSFALDLVQKRGNLIGLNDNLTLFENENDRKTVLKEILINNQNLFETLRQNENINKLLNRVLSSIAEQKKRFITPELYESDGDFKRVYEAYNENLRIQNAIDFDDILLFAYRILTENPKVQSLYASLYKYIFVDEAQDLNFAQYEVIKALCGDKIKNVMLVGDANQSIYAFSHVSIAHHKIDLVYTGKIANHRPALRAFTTAWIASGAALFSIETEIPLQLMLIGVVRWFNDVGERSS